MPMPQVHFCVASHVPMNENQRLAARHLHAFSVVRKTCTSFPREDSCLFLHSALFETDKAEADKMRCYLFW